VPPLDSLDAAFAGGSAQADAAYALAYRAVAELAALDRERGLALFFKYWKESGSFDRALRAAYGLTQAGFEDRWTERTRRRFGGLAFLANMTLAVGVLLLLILPLYLVRRERDRRRLAALRAADEAAERASRESALEELLRGAQSPPSAPPPAAES
jgi:hypothetical protein